MLRMSALIFSRSVCFITCAIMPSISGSFAVSFGFDGEYAIFSIRA